MIKFIADEIGNPDKWTASSVAGLSANRKRLQTLKEVINENLRTRAKARGFALAAQPVSTSDKDAEEWLRTHPNHPKAKQVGQNKRTPRA